jgi:hypothetical protein
VKTADEVTGQQNGHARSPNGHHRSSAARLFLQPRGMRKVRCPHCSVINLEKFVTYPHCAGCGALLTKETAPRHNWTAWRRPLGPILWATVLCCAGAAAVGAAMMLRRPAVMGQMVVYGQTMRNVPVNGMLRLSLTMDSIDGSSRENSVLEDVTVRFDEAFLRAFPLQDVKPPAQSQSRSGSGHYFLFKRVPRETQIDFTFKSLQAGRHKLRTRISAGAHQPTEFSANITVVTKPLPKTEKTQRR